MGNSPLVSCSRKGEGELKPATSASNFTDVPLLRDSAASEDLHLQELTRKDESLHDCGLLMKCPIEAGEVRETNNNDLPKDDQVSLPPASPPPRPPRCLRGKPSVASMPPSVLLSTRRKSWISSRSKALRATLVFADSHAVLTDERRHFIRRSWSQIVKKHGKLQPGILMFHKIFELSPDFGKFFGIYGSPEIEDLSANPGFRRHASVFANLFDLVVRNIFQLEAEIGPVLLMYGRRHFFKHKIAFHEDYLLVMAQGLVDFFEAEVDSGDSEDALGLETKNAWNILVTYMVNKVNEGNMLEVLDSNSLSSGIFSLETFKRRLTLS